MMFQNDYYELDYDAAKNQVQWKIKGLWNSIKDVPHLEADWAAVLQLARQPGFNILADLTEMAIPPREVQDMLTELHDRLTHGGVNKMAIVTSSATLRRLFRQVGSLSGTVYLTCHFVDRQRAQAWLDKN